MHEQSTHARKIAQRIARGATPAESVGCCRAASKEACTRPPCPCNLNCWTRDELDALRRKATP